MQKWFCLAFLSLILSSCGGQRNASEIYDWGSPPYQKPTGDDSWTQIYAASVLDDHQLKVSLDYYQAEYPTVSYEIFVDEVLKTVKVFGPGANEKFASLSCIQETNGICWEYEINSILKFSYHVQHLAPLKIKAVSNSGSVDAVFPMTLIEQKDSYGTRRLAATTVPTQAVIYWLNEMVYFPNVTNGLSPMAFGLPGNLQEPLSFYRFLYLTEMVGASENVLYGRFEHILSGRQEVVEWHLSK